MLDLDESLLLPFRKRRNGKNYLDLLHVLFVHFDAEFPGRLQGSYLLLCTFQLILEALGLFDVRLVRRDGGLELSNLHFQTGRLGLRFVARLGRFLPLKNKHASISET